MRLSPFSAGLLLLAAAAPSQERSRPRRVAPTEDYATRAVEGWTVRVDRRLLEEKKDLGDRALRLLEKHLYDIGRRVPEPALAALRRIPLWMAVEEGTGVGVEYHPSREWLQNHGHNPDKAKAVEIGDPEKYLRCSLDQPFVILHELAHGYHDRELGFDDARILEAYENARKSGSYESVLGIDGRKKRHYALTDPKEYFAESTEAFFGTNDFYPFVRAELQEHDPGMFRLLEEIWRGRKREAAPGRR